MRRHVGAMMPGEYALLSSDHFIRAHVQKEVEGGSTLVVRRRPFAKLFLKVGITKLMEIACNGSPL